MCENRLFRFLHIHTILQIFEKNQKASFTNMHKLFKILTISCRSTQTDSYSHKNLCKSGHSCTDTQICADLHCYPPVPSSVSVGNAQSSSLRFQSEGYGSLTLPRSYNSEERIEPVRWNGGSRLVPKSECLGLRCRGRHLWRRPSITAVSEGPCFQ